MLFGFLLIILNLLALTLNGSEKFYLDKEAAKRAPSIAAHKARLAAAYAQQEAEVAAGIERLLDLDRQVNREFGCKKCIKLQKLDETRRKDAK